MSMKSQVSVYDVAVAAEEVMRANQFSWGRYLATVDVPDDGACEIAEDVSEPTPFHDLPVRRDNSCKTPEPRCLDSRG